MEMNTFDSLKKPNMKNIFLCSSLFLLLAGTSVHAQISSGVAFEYSISSSEGATGEFKGYFSEIGFRSEMTMHIAQMPGGGFSRTSLMLKDKPGISIMLDDKAKTYSENEIKPRPAGNPDSCLVKILGNEKIGKYNCVHSQVTENHKVSEFWTTKDIPDYEKYAAVHKGGRYMGRGNTEAALKKAGADGFLVKTFSKEGRGGETSMELTKFEKQNLSADLFTIPAAYTKTAPSPDYSKMKDMTPEERQKFMENMKKQNGGGK
jgi:hypothetical protein